MRVILVLLFFFIIPVVSHGETVWQSSSPVGNYTIDFPVSGTGENRVPNYLFVYSIPYGITFDRVQMSVPSTQGVISKNEGFEVGTLNQYPWTCLNSDCYDSATTSITFSVQSETKADIETYQWVFTSSTTVLQSGSVLKIVFDPNAPYTDFSYNGAFQESAAALNGSQITKSYTVPSIKLCNNSCDDNSFLVQPTVVYSSIFDTRFTGVSGITLATSTNTISFDVAYYIDSSELDTTNAARNITMILADYETGTSSQDFAQTGEYITPTNGNATTSMSVTSSAFANDGTYTFKVSFGNLGTQITGIYPFSETYLYFDVVVSGGVISQTIVDSPYTPLTNDSNTVYPCSFTEFYGCIVNAFRYLFLPSPTAVASLTTVLSSSTIPFVASAYESYRVTTEAIQTNQNASSTLTYNFEIPEANIDVTMISASTITQGLGSAAGMFRSIALVVLVFGFLSMIVREIRGQISITGASSVVGDSYRSGSIRR